MRLRHHSSHVACATDTRRHLWASANSISSANTHESFYEVAVSLRAPQRVGIQLSRARCTELHQKANDLAREAVNCNAGLGGQQLEICLKRAGRRTASWPLSNLHRENATKEMDVASAYGLIQVFYHAWTPARLPQVLLLSHSITRARGVSLQV